MVKIQARSVNNSRLFQEAVRDLCNPITHADIAEALDCSVSLLRQALRDPDAAAFRNPPAGWETSVRRLAEGQIDRFSRLAEKLRG